MRIDAHQHFWRYNPGDYGWMGTADDNTVLRQDWMPALLRPLLDDAGIDACIAVQARSDEAETDFLLELAAQHAWIAAVIGWADLGADDLAAQLDGWRQNPGQRALAGLRHPLQDDPDIALTLTDPGFNRGLQLLQRQRLVYELLVCGSRQLAQLPAFARRHDAHWLVLDHLGKPDIGGDDDRAWEDALRALAQMPHVACKLSGLVTEVRSTAVQRDVIGQYLDIALEAFGPQRLLFGSDWPVCLLRAQYPQVLALVEDWCRSRLTAGEHAQIMGGNAARIYAIDTQVTH